MKTKTPLFALFLFLLSSALVADGIDARATLISDTEPGVSLFDGSDIFLRSRSSYRFRTRPERTKFAIVPVRRSDTPPGCPALASTIKGPFDFLQCSHQDLYKLHEVYRF